MNTAALLIPSNSFIFHEFSHDDYISVLINLK